MSGRLRWLERQSGRPWPAGLCCHAGSAGAARARAPGRRPGAAARGPETVDSSQVHSPSGSLAGSDLSRGSQGFPTPLPRQQMQPLHLHGARRRPLPDSVERTAFETPAPPPRPATCPLARSSDIASSLRRHPTSLDQRRWAGARLPPPARRAANGSRSGRHPPMEGGADEPRQQRASGCPVRQLVLLHPAQRSWIALPAHPSTAAVQMTVMPDSGLILWFRSSHPPGPVLVEVPSCPMLMDLGRGSPLHPAQRGGSSSIPSPAHSCRRRSRGARAPGPSPATAARLAFDELWRRSATRGRFRDAVSRIGSAAGRAQIAAVDAVPCSYAWSTSASSRARPPRSKRGGAGAPLGRRSNAGARRARSSPAPTRAERGLRRGGSAGARDALEWTWWPRTESSSHLDVAASWRYSDGHA